MEGAYTLNTPIPSTDTSLPIAVRDGLLRDVPNAGVRFLADLPFGFCYPGGPLAGRAAPAAPANNAAVYDLAELGNGRVVLASGQGIGYAGGGFDFSGITARNTGSYLAIPASVAADLSDQYYLISALVKLPTLAQWSTSTSMAPFFSFANSNAAAGMPDIVSVGMVMGGTISSVRQTGGSTLVSLSASLQAGDYGKLAEVSFWRNPAGTGITVKTANLRSTATGPVGADNIEDFSAQVGKVGVTPAYWSPTLLNQAAAVNFRVYGAFVENLARSGRDPLTVLDARWDRIQARIAASAAANGGTSLIFV